MVNDSLTIKVRQAPISKINIYPDHIDIVTGYRNESILRTFKIEEKKFLNKYISLPAYINNLLENEVKNTSFILDGVYSSEGFIPEDDEFDTYDFDEYYNRSGTELRTDRDLDLIEYISTNYAILLSTATHNLTKEYLLQILEVDRYMNPDPDIEADENGVIRLYKPRVRLSVMFQKIDAVYKSRNKYIDYHDIDSTHKFNALVEDVTDESLVDINNSIGIIVSKYKD